MEIHEHIAALRHEGGLLADVASDIDLDAPIPTCPDWRLRDLLRHTGFVHRWATAQVGRRLAAPMDEQAENELAIYPDDAALVEWFRAGLGDLARTLEAAPPELECWSFLPAPSPLAFWARRQAHETAIHRSDVESIGGRITPFPPGFAVDGIDELLCGFVNRGMRRLRADPLRTLHVHAGDTKGEWLVQIGPESAVVSREHAKGDCAVRGAASDLYLLLWNRRAPDGLEVFGDAALLDLWRTAVRIRWS